MSPVLSIARTTFLQQFRNRLYLVIVFFGAVLLAVSLLFGALAADQEVRVLLDFGLAATELLGLVTAVFGAVTIILEEMESRTLYLILTRPLPRWQYLAGRYLGLVAAVGASLLLMAAMHAGLLLLKGWAWDPRYAAALLLVCFKIVMGAALAVFFSLFSSSSVSSVVFTFFFWLLGHFGSEVRFLLGKSGNAAALFLSRAVLFLTPDFQALNYRDVFHAPGASLAPFAAGIGHAALYSAACLALSVALFSRKEF